MSHFAVFPGTFMGMLVNRVKANFMNYGCYSIVITTLEKGKGSAPKTTIYSDFAKKKGNR